MNVDPRLQAMRLTVNWLRKVELDELSLDNAWDLLRERVGAIDKSLQPCDICQQLPCPNPSYCQSCREADAKIVASRKCAQCGSSGGILDPHRHLDSAGLCICTPIADNSGRRATDEAQRTTDPGHRDAASLAAVVA